MNHAAICEHEAKRVYGLRSYILGDLDERHCAALIEDDHFCGLNGYCLDAVDELPRGSMSTGVGRPAQGFTLRGVSLAEHQEREALADELIAEILAEEVAA